MFRKVFDGKVQWLNCKWRKKYGNFRKKHLNLNLKKNLRKCSYFLKKNSNLELKNNEKNIMIFESSSQIRRWKEIFLFLSEIIKKIFISHIYILNNLVCLFLHRNFQFRHLFFFPSWRVKQSFLQVSGTFLS